MQITLKIDGKNKTFVTDFISARMVRRTIEVSKGINFNDMSPEELDQMVGFVVELFSNKFTIDDVYDGLSSKELIPTMMNCINEVVGGMSEATAGDEKNE
ncbi:phage tail assembly chaperone G [Alkaliphilus transvaalensis]|uniref:phage tail assembly chaperone G n=1 Tax=Alkaliphilus transvaalensis TaxID=114628 RepID=UPI00047E8EB2|nr:hypothetical protein [Alkaliphilus transvaalensis]